jgi:ribonuclease P/MRP protein subunit POP5
LLKRTKRRYLALEVDSAETFEPKEFADGIWSAITRLYGEHGASQTGLVMIHCDMERKFALIRVTNAASDMVRAALAAITKIGDKPASIHVIAVSGTIKALQKRVKQR